MIAYVYVYIHVCVCVYMYRYPSQLKIIRVCNISINVFPQYTYIYKSLSLELFFDDMVIKE